MKKYILIAGVNGAGKSTLYQTLDSLQAMERVNTDEIAYRVAHGGHGIPDADVERRYKNGDLYILSDQIPMWFEKYIK